MVRHASAHFAKNRRKHGFPAFRRFRVVRVFPAAGAVQIDPAGTGTQPYVSMRLCKKAPQDWCIVDDCSTAAGRFDPLGSSVTDVQGGEHDGQIDDEDDIVKQIDAACQRKGHLEYRVIWEGYPDPTWETDITLSTAEEQVQAMIREARNCAEGEQKGTRKAARARKAGVNLFTALEPSLA
eukprot:6213592-Pleurochrysis_carterae.AAC.2